MEHASLYRHVNTLISGRPLSVQSFEIGLHVFKNQKLAPCTEGDARFVWL